MPMATPSVPDDLGHALFREAADQSFQSITVTRSTGADAPSEIIYVNDAFTEMTGYEAEEVMGQTPGMLQGPKTDPEVLERLDRTIHNGEVFHGRRSTTGRTDPSLSSNGRSRPSITRETPPTTLPFSGT